MAATKEEFPVNWKWMLFLGILDIILGTVGIILASLLTLTTVLVFGIFLFIGGIFQLIQGIRDKEERWSGRLAHFSVAILYLVGGVLIFLNPLSGATVLTLILAAVFLIIGLFRMGLAITFFRNNWRWVLHFVGGLISLALGVFIILNWPVSSLWIIGLIVALELLFNGWQLVWISLAVKKLEKK